MQEIVLKEGMLISDNGKVGIIVKEIKSGTWSEAPLFNWRTNYEIYFFSTGDVTIIGEETVRRLMELGSFKILDDKP